MKPCPLSTPCPRNAEFCADCEHEALDSQVERLANFIMKNVPGEPSQNEGAIDTAIRVLEKHYPTATAVECAFCQGNHSEDACPVVFKPIKECEFSDPIDGCCFHPENQTPECHVNACPRLDSRICKAFNDLHP